MYRSEEGDIKDQSSGEAGATSRTLVAGRESKLLRWTWAVMLGCGPRGFSRGWKCKLFMSQTPIFKVLVNKIKFMWGHSEGPQKCIKRPRQAHRQAVAPSLGKFLSQRHPSNTQSNPSSFPIFQSDTSSSRHCLLPAFWSSQKCALLQYLCQLLLKLWTFTSRATPQEVCTDSHRIPILGFMAQWICTHLAQS